VEILGECQHPSERIIAVVTADGGRETVYVDKDSIDSSTIEIGHPVGSTQGRLLIELPRETTSGRWRVWVNKSDVLEGVPA
jgi:hypothetical protein